MATTDKRNMPDEKRCKARNRQGNRCNQWAMSGTTVCRLHGGKGALHPNVGRPVQHGRYSMRLQNILQGAARLEELEQDPELLNMNRTLATSQMLIELYMPALDDESLRGLLKRRYLGLDPDYEPSDAEVMELRLTLLKSSVDALAKHGDMQAKAKRVLTQEQVLTALVVPVLQRLGHDFMGIVAKHTSQAQLDAIKADLAARQARAVIEVQGLTQQATSK